MRFLVQLTRYNDSIAFELDGRLVEVVEPTASGARLSLLEALRDHLGCRAPKDGCGPQGQCGCCTVWVDGQPRVACVTALRRVAGRSVTTIDGLSPEVKQRWAAAFTAAGASQCGFCTPGIIMRLASLEARGSLSDEASVRNALVAHLCRCTGWQTIVEAALGQYQASTPRDLAAASRRAGIEGGTDQKVGPEVALGRGGFAEDSAPSGCLVAVPDGSGGWVVADSLAEARHRAGKIQGRRSTAALRWPLEPPPGEWDVTLQTTFVDPAYLEPDASWCEPGGEPASCLANGGAFGGKLSSGVGEFARRLASEYGRPVRVVLSREDVVRLGPKRPPIAAGVRSDGTGVVLVGFTPGSIGGAGAWAAAANAVAPGLEVVPVQIPGPPVSPQIRAAGWAEATALVAGASRQRRVEVTSPDGGWAAAEMSSDGILSVTVRPGEVLDPVVVRSYAIGAAHQAIGWVRQEALAVSEDGEVLDLTIRSLGVIPARAMGKVEVAIEPGEGPPVAVSGAVFAAAAGALWVADGLPPRWPHRRERVSGG